MTAPSVGAYRGERLLGLGAEGQVWRARGPRGVVALKVARRADRGLAASAELLRVARHPHIVRYVQAGPGWLVTELVEGEPAHRWARHREVGVVIEVALEILSALRHLHALGLVHGDVKPANVLVDSWGHAKVLDPLGARAGAAGTPGFVAPEVVSGGPRTPASDAWAFGALLYAMLVGRGPFDAEDAAAALHGPARALPLPASTWRSDLPAPVDGLVLQLLDRDPAARPDLARVEAALVASYRAPPSRPLFGMERCRRALLAALARASEGEAVVVVLHGPQGSGRRTLTGEVLRRGRGVGLEPMPRFEAAAFLAAASAGRLPVAGSRVASAEAVDAARRLRDAGHGGLLVLHGTSPSTALGEAGAIHLTPDALSRDDAERLAAWLGVRDAGAAHAAWEQSEGLPRALWLALESHATRGTTDRAPFAIPMRAMAILEALGRQDEAMPLDRLADRVGQSLAQVADSLPLLFATGRVQMSDDGWRIRRSA